MHNKIKNKILAILCNRVPNFVSETSIQQRLAKYSKEDIREELKSLVKAKIVESNHDYKGDSDQAILYFRVTKREGLPVRETIKVGNVDIPRLLSDSQPYLFPSIFDEQLESLAEFSQNLESRFLKMIEQERRKLLANVVGVLGVIVSVLAMVIVGLPKIQTDSRLPFWDVV